MIWTVGNKQEEPECRSRIDISVAVEVQSAQNETKYYEAPV